MFPIQISRQIFWILCRFHLCVCVCGDCSWIWFFFSSGILSHFCELEKIYWVSIWVVYPSNHTVLSTASPLRCQGNKIQNTFNRPVWLFVKTFYRFESFEWRPLTLIASQTIPFVYIYLSYGVAIKHQVDNIWVTPSNEMNAYSRIQIVWKTDSGNVSNCEECSFDWLN